MIRRDAPQSFELSRASLTLQHQNAGDDVVRLLRRQDQIGHARMRRLEKGAQTEPGRPGILRYVDKPWSDLGSNTLLSRHGLAAFALHVPAGTDRWNLDHVTFRRVRTLLALTRQGRG